MNSDINHTEEMERAYYEAYRSCQEISPIIREWDFFQFAEFITKLNNKLIGPVPFKEIVVDYDDGDDFISHRDNSDVDVVNKILKG